MANAGLVISNFEMPADGNWATPDDVPDELRDVLEIYNCALRDDVDGEIRPMDVQALHKLYYGLKDQDVIVARDEDGCIVGVASIDCGRQPAFLEGVATHPELRRSGVARDLVRYALQFASEQGINVVHSRSQRSSLRANLKTLARIGLADATTVDDTHRYPLITIRLAA